MGVACSQSVLPDAASQASTTSSRGLPYIVYRTLFWTAGELYPSPSGRFHMTFGPPAGHCSFNPAASVWKLRFGPPHWVQGTAAAGLPVWAKAGAAAICTKVRRVIWRLDREARGMFQEWQV